MNDDALKQLWQSQKFNAPSALTDAEQIARARRGVKQLEHTIFWRDIREVAVGLVGMLWFGSELFHSHSVMSLLGCWILILSFIFISATLLFNQRRVPAADPAAPMEDFIRCDLRKAEVQIRLLRSVLWWYLLPIMVGVNLFFAGSGLDLFSDLSYLFLTVGLSVFLWWVNLWAVKQTLLPLKVELESLLGQPPDVTITKPKLMKKLLLLILFTGICAVPLLWATTVTNSLPVTDRKLSDEEQIFEGFRKQHQLPALAVVVVKDGKICDRVAVGIRNVNDPVPITTNDLFHIGSCTKSMTATLAAMFIEEGKLRWNTTIVEVFPELKGKMDPRYETVTVEQLLTQRSGVPGEPPPAAWARAWKEVGTPVEQRYAFISAVLAQPPAVAPGTKFIYSNQNYALVGAMLEKIAGRSWEELITEKLFKPLHMDSAGFGVPGTKGKVNQPWGHARKFSVTLPVQRDNPPAISPAGRVHCSLDDLARYVIFQMEGERTNGLLKAETVRKLHTPPAGGDYACGWVCLERDWAGGRTLMHNGSNTMWYVVMWLAPEKDFAVIAATNIAGSGAEDGCDDAASAMIGKWLGE
ncbi:MAG TPA: serine hydrolase domain-containing protein [Verrucomicrobiae bacterium]|jgi:CubicO group peptidase (beta-lactamase class C family)